MLRHEIFSPKTDDTPFILALFSYRYDAHLVPGLLQNIKPFVHGYVAFDDHKASALFSSEPERRNLLLNRASELGATWILVLDPDERFETRLANELPNMTSKAETTVWSFPLRELITPTAWRSDGVWGNKTVDKLFRLLPGSQAHSNAFHGKWIAGDQSGRTRKSDVNIYHLRSAHARRRKLRRDLYASVDPDRNFQKIGYDYLNDERGMTLESISADKSYLPMHIEDRGLWAASAKKIKNTPVDPVRCKLHFANSSLQLGNKVGAYHAVCDILHQFNADSDLKEVAYRIAPNTTDPSAIVPMRGRNLSNTLASIEALSQADRFVSALLQQKRAEQLAPKAPAVMFSGYKLLRKDSNTFGSQNAAWRRWTKNDAILREGNQVQSSLLAVIIISYKSQLAVVDAVASVLDSNEVAEVVVVNSGGGQIFDLLAPFEDRLRMINCVEPLNVGAARNIGVDATTSPYLSFLAADCTMKPGWIEKRILLHRAGHGSISNPVETERQNLVGLASNLLRFWSRQPTTPDDEVSHFGRSEPRKAFHAAGYFPTGLRVGEDTYHNSRLEKFAPAFFARDITTKHKDPVSFVSYCFDEFRRGMRRADHPPYRGLMTSHNKAGSISDIQSRRMAKVRLENAKHPSARKLERIQSYALKAEKLGILWAIQKLALSFRLAQRAVKLQSHNKFLALSFVKLALRLDQQNSQRHYHLGALKSHSPLEHLKQQAIEHFKIALSITPHHFQSLGAWAQLLEQNGKADEALNVVAEYCIISPTTVGYFDMACEMAFRAGQYDLALHYGRTALSREPNNPLFHRRLANIHIVQGDQAQALRRVKMAEDLEKDLSP